MQARGTIFVIDDDPQVRGILTTFPAETGLCVEFPATAEEFLERTRGGDDWPCCLVLDVRLPGLSGLGLQERLNQADAAIPVVFLTAYGDIPTAVQAIKAGAVDFLEKPPQRQLLLECIRRAMDLSVERRLEQSRQDALRSRISDLSVQERKVFDLLLNGRSNKEIAVDLQIGVPTVTKHRSKVLHKLGAASVVDLVKIVASSA